MNLGSHQCIFYLSCAQPMPTDINDVIHSSCDLVVAVFSAVRPITRKILTYDSLTPYNSLYLWLLSC